MASLIVVDLTLSVRSSATAATTGTLANPEIVGNASLEQQPNRYVAVTKVTRDGELVDVHETRASACEPSNPTAARASS